MLARLAEQEAASGANPAARAPVHAGISAAGVPRLAFGQGKDCTFIGALEAALAPSRRASRATGRSSRPAAPAHLDSKSAGHPRESPARSWQSSAAC